LPKWQNRNSLCLTGAFPQVIEKLQVAEIKQDLNQEAERISHKYDGAPVVVIVAGSAEASVPACTTAFANLGQGREGRLRDLLGILQTAMQIETFNHFPIFPRINQQNEAIKEIARHTGASVDL
jgi:hypothetical protein